MEFDSRNNANRFFQAYFSGTEGAQAYAKKYLADYTAAKNTISAGNSYNSDGTVLDASGAESVMAYCDDLRSAYSNLCLTLSPDLDPEGAATCFDYFVGELPGGTTAFTLGGEVRGVISRTDCATSVYPKANVIICTGSVTVDSAFKGLILSLGSVTLRGSATASSLTSEALTAVDESGRTLLSYLDPRFDLTLEGGGESGGSWDMDALVEYRNWSKN